MEATARKLELSNGSNGSTPIARFLKSDDPVSLELIVPAIERIKAFCRMLGAQSDNDPEILARAVMSDFFTDGGQFLIAVATSEDRIVGHLLATVTCPTWGTEKRIIVLQHWYDEDFTMPIAVAKKVFDAIIKWGKDNDVHRIDTVVLNEKIARRLRIFYGFKDDLRQMTRAI